PALFEGVPDAGQVKPGGEVLAVGEDQGAARVVVPFVLAQCQDQVVQHRLVEGIALGRAVEADQYDVAAQFTADATGGTGGHGWLSFVAMAGGQEGYRPAQWACPLPRTVWRRGSRDAEKAAPEQDFSCIMRAGQLTAPFKYCVFPRRFAFGCKSGLRTTLDVSSIPNKAITQILYQAARVTHKVLHGMCSHGTRVFADAHEADP